MPFRVEARARVSIVEFHSVTEPGQEALEPGESIDQVKEDRRKKDSISPLAIRRTESSWDLSLQSDQEESSSPPALEKKT
jgi:hypothetical protein